MQVNQTTGMPACFKWLTVGDHMLTKLPKFADFSDVLKWRTFVRVSLLLLVLIASLFLLDMSLNEKQFQTHRQNIQNQYAFQLERLIESSADKMIQLSGAASLNDGLVKAIRSRKTFLIEEQLEALDWHLQADAGLSIVGLFDARGQTFKQIESLAHQENLVEVIRNERPVWQVDCVQTCQILSYTPLLVEGALLSVLVLSEPLSHVLLRFHHVANIDTGLLTQLETAQDSQSVLPNWQRNLQAVTSPDQSRRVLAEASMQFSLAELQQGPKVIDLNDHLYELKALPFKNSQLVVMTEASYDYALLEQAKSKSIKIASFMLFLGEIVLFAFLWTPLSRLKFSEKVVSLLIDRRFDELKIEVEQARPEQQQLARNALRLGDDFIAMQRQIVNQTLKLDAIHEEVIEKGSELAMALDEFAVPVMLLNNRCQIMMVNHYLKAQLCLPYVSLLGKEVFALLSLDSNLQTRLMDVLDGNIPEYQYRASCQDDKQQSHTFLWRFSLLKANSYSEDTELRQLLVIGMPLSEPSLDDQREWLAHHDLETTLLNAKGFRSLLDKRLTTQDLHATDKLSTAKSGYLVLVRLPAFLLNESQVSRLHLLKAIQHLYAIFSNLEPKQTSLFSRLEENEFAFVYDGDDVSSLLKELRNFLFQALDGFLTKVPATDLNIASYLIQAEDCYALDVLAKTRTVYCSLA